MLVGVFVVWCGVSWGVSWGVVGCGGVGWVVRDDDCVVIVCWA